MAKPENEEEGLFETQGPIPLEEPHGRLVIEFDVNTLLNLYESFDEDDFLDRFRTNELFFQDQQIFIRMPEFKYGDDLVLATSSCFIDSVLEYKRIMIFRVMDCIIFLKSWGPQNDFSVLAREIRLKMLLHTLVTYL